MKTMMMNPMRMRMCCCCCSNMQMRSNKENINQHIINKYKERVKHEKISIYNSIALRAAS